ncbi:MAG: deoxynucleoside kinase [Nitrospirae bacterium]|nr:deoxynucleoside kinase [Nitrospirota bacterium]
MKEPKYVVIEGPIGVGKTSLVKLLSRELNGRLVLERAEDNPFLKEFYKDPKRFAFQTQIFFLLSRYRQLQELSQMDLFERTTITDYFFPKDRIFASINLEASELSLYQQLYSLLNPHIPTPDLVVYLQADTDVLMDRVRHRGLDYEKPLTFDYLDALNQAYNDFFFQYTDSPLLVVQTSEIDFVNRRADLDDLLHQIKQMKKGTQYYVPRK